MYMYTHAYIHTYIHKTMTIFIQSTLINYPIIKTHYHYPIFQILRIFLTGKYVNHFCIFFTGIFLGLKNLLEIMMSSFLLVLSPLPHLQQYSTMSNQGQ